MTTIPFGDKKYRFERWCNGAQRFLNELMMMTAMPDPRTSYVPKAQALLSKLGDETVILHLECEAYFGIDAVGMAVWERLQAGDTFEDLCEHVRGHFDDVPETVEEEIAAFLEQLAERALIEPR